jgi:hypothetical protein
MAIAEQIGSISNRNEVNHRPIVVVPEMPGDELVRNRAERFIRSVGRISVGEAIEADRSDECRPGSLMDAIHQAAEGDEEALELVKADVGTDVIERTIKAGHIMSVKLALGSDGGIQQHGQSVDSIQANTLRYASGMWQMRERAEAESRNSFRIDSFFHQGLLEDYNFVVFSRAADNMTEDELSKAGFFVDTRSCAIQCTSANGDELTTESAFVAGKKELGGEPHDQQTIAEVGASLGVNYRDISATEIIDTPLLIHKSLIPNGAIDLVKLYDEIAGTFFGEAKPRQDYLIYREMCRQRVITYAPKIQQIVGELLAESRQIDTPLKAVERLHKISERNMLQQSVYDHSINPLVFGRPAAQLIEQARLQYEKGNIELSQVVTNKAIKVAKSSSCPSSISVRESSDDSAGDTDQPETESWHGGKKFFNSKCQACNKVKPEVGACHICEDCVKNPRKIKKTYEEEKANRQKPAGRLPKPTSKASKNGKLKSNETKPAKPSDVQQKGRLAVDAAK